MELSPEQELSRVVLSAITQPDRPIDTQTLFLGAMELGDESRQPLMEDAELRNPLQYLLLNHVVTPLIKNAIPEETAEPLKTAIAKFSRIVSAPEVPAEEIQAVRRQVEELRRLVRNQQTHIDELRKRFDNP